MSMGIILKIDTDTEYASTHRAVARLEAGLDNSRSSSSIKMFMTRSNDVTNFKCVMRMFLEPLLLYYSSPCYSPSQVMMVLMWQSFVQE